ncbi:MAG: hypothetical protein U0Q16_21575 [Bryobacteraceae bacterium]
MAHSAMPDSLLDTFVPVYDIVERHQIHTEAPAVRTFAAACAMEMSDSWLVRLIFRAREWLFGAKPSARQLPHGLIEQTKALGWGVLAEAPGREIVMGAVTQPWLADVEFRALPPLDFARFHEPGFVKIAWTLRADPDDGGSLFRTETRAVATDSVARDKFRRYWRRVWPGVWLIRRLMLGPLKRRAESRIEEVPCTSRGHC